MTSLAQRGGCQADPGESRPRPGQGRSACCCRRQSRAVNQISRKFSPHLKKMSFDCTFSLLRIYYRYLLTKPPQSSQWLTLRTSVAISGFYPPRFAKFLACKSPNRCFEQGEGHSEAHDGLLWILWKFAKFRSQLYRSGCCRWRLRCRGDSRCQGLTPAAASAISHVTRPSWPVWHARDIRDSVTSWSRESLFSGDTWMLKW